MDENVIIRDFEEKDCEIISDAFEEKPYEQYQRYFDEQTVGKRKILVADFKNEFAGYLTIIWESLYPSFAKNNIPEIVDFNVLKKFRRKGIGTKLMDTAEGFIAKSADSVGIGVGVFSDYGNAQRLYVKRGYIPDGHGISQDSVQIKYGDEVIIDHSIALHFTKKLK